MPKGVQAAQAFGRQTPDHRARPINRNCEYLWRSRRAMSLISALTTL